jgi:hypothetical protein
LDPCDPDTDSDGCTDAAELGTNRIAGGRRDPAYYWDFFDTPDDTGQRDRLVSIGDILRVIDRFGAVGDPGQSPLSPIQAAPAYHSAFDRQFATAIAARVTLRPDGSITTGDIMDVVAQFGHSCV